MLTPRTPGAATDTPQANLGGADAPARGRRYAGVSDDQRRAERYERFMAAGLELFGTLGFEATTTRALCAASGLTQRYFYESFQNTEALFVAVVDRQASLLRARLLRAIAAEQSPKVLLRSALGDYYAMLQADARVARILLIEVYTASPRTHRFARSYVADLAELVHRAMLRMRPDLRSAPIDLRLLSAGLIGAGHHIGLQWVQDGFCTPIEHVVETTLRLYGAAFTTTGSD